MFLNFFPFFSETNKKLMDEVKKLTGENAKQVEIIKAKDGRN